MDATAALPFTKFAILPSELRSHIISYNDHKTLAKYAQCSQLCNVEIQRYNTRPPWKIKFTHDEKSATVELFYERNDNSKFRYAFYFNKFDNPVQFDDWWRRQDDSNSVIKVSDKEPYQAAMEYVKDRFKYVKTGECERFDFFGEFYLPELSTIASIKKFDWTVNFDEKMYQKFYDSVKMVKNERLGLELIPKTNEEYNLPLEFFQCEFFQNLSHLKCDSFLQGLQEQELLTMKAKNITIECSAISDKAINQKIQQWTNNPINQPVEYNFSRSNKIFDKSVILESFKLTDKVPFFTTVLHPNGSPAIFDDSNNKIRFITTQSELLLETYNFFAFL